MDVTIRCPNCQAEGPMWIPQNMLQATYINCPLCQIEMRILECVVDHKKDQTLKKRSVQQEKRAAARCKGRVQPASGALAHAKGDVVKKGRLRQECKYTLAKSYTLKLEDLVKIKKEARLGEIPMLEIEFQGVHPIERWVIVPEHYFRGMLEQANDNKKNR